MSGIIGTFQGVRSPGTAYVLLHHYMGEIDGAFRSWGFARGGTGMVSNAIASAARSHGAEIRTEAGVSQVIIVEGGRAVGVVLENGDEMRARTVVSGLEPRTAPSSACWARSTCPATSSAGHTPLQACAAARAR